MIEAMKVLQSAQMSNWLGGEARCTKLGNMPFFSFRATYWACSDGYYYMTLSKYSATLGLWVPIFDKGVAENWN
jgi:hypothetical protein